MTGRKLFGIIVKALQQDTTDDRLIRTDGSMILCRREEMADAIADMLDAVEGEVFTHTGYYDPEADKYDNCVDEYTGWYYIDFD